MSSLEKKTPRTDSCILEVLRLLEKVTFFKLLHIVGMDTNLEGELKKLVKERNDYAHANGRLLLTSEEFFLEKIRNFNHCIDRVFALIKNDVLQLYSSTLNDPDFYDPDIRAYLDPTQQVQEEITKKIFVVSF